MAKVTFTNEQLCKTWGIHAATDPRGTRGDVVTDLMGQMGADPEDEDASKKCYNNVTQRRKQLIGKGIVFQDLTPGPKGARQTQEQIDALQGLMDGDMDDEDCLVT